MIKRRNLDNSLIQWIMTVTGLGPGIGEIRYVAPAASATSQYRTQLQTNGVDDDDLHTTLALGEDKLVAYRNDVLLAMPGAYLETASLAWDKANTHIIGLGGPNMWGDHVEPNVCFYTTGVAVAHVLDITGQNCIFINLNFQNGGANAACVSAVKINKYAAYFKSCRIAGNIVSAQNASANCCSLWIAEAGMYPVLIDCQIGQDVWGNRTTANAGVIKYETTSGASAGRPNGSDFINSRILSVGDDSNCAMVRVTAATAIGRGHRFDNSIFSHFDGAAAGAKDLTRAFYTPSTAVQKDIIHLHNCMGIGITEWQDDDDDVVWADMPITGLGGGLGRNPTAPVGT